MQSAFQWNHRWLSSFVAPCYSHSDSPVSSHCWSWSTHLPFLWWQRIRLHSSGQSCSVCSDRWPPQTADHLIHSRHGFVRIFSFSHPCLFWLQSSAGGSTGLVLPLTGLWTGLTQSLAADISQKYRRILHPHLNCACYSEFTNLLWLTWTIRLHFTSTGEICYRFKLIICGIERVADFTDFNLGVKETKSS